MGVAAGLRASVSAVVADEDTAIRAGSGDVPVLATPRLLALAEAAAVAAISPHLPSGVTSVGTSASLEHRRASPVGAEVVVEAELTEIDVRRLVFSFIARESRHQTGAPDDGGGEDRVVGAGTVERVLVNRQAFLARAAGGHRP
jgi:fluoroacetyl-CoA thioesterase